MNKGKQVYKLGCEEEYEKSQNQAGIESQRMNEPEKKQQ